MTNLFETEAEATANLRHWQARAVRQAESAKQAAARPCATAETAELCYSDHSSFRAAQSRTPRQRTGPLLSLNKMVDLPPPLAEHLGRKRRAGEQAHDDRQDRDRGAHESKRQAKRAEGRRIGAFLRDLAPTVFGETPAPLTVGINRDILELLAGDAEPQAIGRFLARWTKRRAYLAALARGEVRCDLNGLPIERPTPAHRQAAAEDLAAIDRRAAATAKQYGRAAEDAPRATGGERKSGRPGARASA